MNIKYYPIQNYNKIVKWHLQEYIYLGTGDNNDIVFISSYSQPSYVVIITIYDQYLKRIIFPKIT